jgi:hypothetical protein
MCSSFPLQNYCYPIESSIAYHERIRLNDDIFEKDCPCCISKTPHNKRACHKISIKWQGVEVEEVLNEVKCLVCMENYIKVDITETREIK